MKTQEELKTLKIKYETLNNKLKELNDEELNIVTGGEGIEWLKEESYDTYGTNPRRGSRQDIIGDWDIEGHSNQ